MKHLKANLPTAFRITGSKGEAGVLLDIVRGQLFSEILNAGVDSKAADEVINAGGDAKAADEIPIAGADTKATDEVPVEMESRKPVCLPWWGYNINNLFF